MLRKKIIIILNIFIITLSLILSGCEQTESKSNDDIDNESKTKNSEMIINELVEKDPPIICSSECVYFSEQERIQMSDLIFRGTIVDKREYVIETVLSDEFTSKNYKTVYSVKISEIYYTSDKEVKVSDTIKVMSPVTSYNWEPEAVQMEKNQEFILFTRLTKDGKNIDGETIKFSDLSKYSLGNPWEPIISVKEDSFEFDPVFKSLAKNASMEEYKIYDNYSKKVLARQDENFISDLLGLIDKYKN